VRLLPVRGAERLHPGSLSNELGIFQVFPNHVHDSSQVQILNGPWGREACVVHLPVSLRRKFSIHSRDNEQLRGAVWGAGEEGSML